MSLRDDLIAAMQVTAAEKPRKVVIKGWGTLYVRDVLVSEVDTSHEAAESLAKATGIAADKVRLARSAAQGIVDEDGKLVFDPDSEADIKLLAAQSWNRLQKVVAEPDSGN